ncbi:MAG: hypothetical protein AKCLJLPJ_02257 [Fimbriimonadales bacterium]|nr:hypothetical protein [Armatimonadota bacterium]MBV6504157.1 hypothetical protein [Fimbriimonadales bacterium]NOG93399.1 hypothetical protein [Armatimonadota bacterium]
MRRTVGSFLVILIVAAATFLLIKFGFERPVVIPEKQSGLRIATYNIAWMGEGMTPERVANLRSVLANLKADIVAVQEAESLKAMRRVFGREWQIAMLNDPSELQELALAVRLPSKVLSRSMVFPDSSLDDAFPGKRDVLRVVVRPPSGNDIVFYVVHMKSRRGGRIETDPQRIKACALLASRLEKSKDERIVVLGDFNDYPDDRSVNILETGDPNARGEMEERPGRLFINLAEDLAKRECVSLELHARFRGRPMQPVVYGARWDNNRLRGVKYRFPDDVNVTQALFDQILISHSLKDAVIGRPFVYAGADALRGAEARRLEGGRQEGSLASDHLPVCVDLRP